MGKICGLKYFYEGEWKWASQNKCDAGWESFGTVEVLKGTAGRIAILYQCDYVLGCDVWFDLIYHPLGDKGKQYGPFRIPSQGQGLAEIILEPIDKDGWISVYAWEKNAFGARVNQDAMFFLVKVIEPVAKGVTVGSPWISPKYPTTEDSVTVHQKVKNVGSITGNIEVKFYIDGKYVGSEYVMLRPGETRTVSKSVGKLDIGKHSVCVWT